MTPDTIDKLVQDLRLSAEHGTGPSPEEIRQALIFVRTQFEGWLRLIAIVQHQLKQPDPALAPHDHIEVAQVMQELIDWIKASGALTGSDADRYMIMRAEAEVNDLRLLEGTHTHVPPPEPSIFSQ